jgi:putative tryptophan/tyrosine transport system substrate-binding protein
MEDFRVRRREFIVGLGGAAGWPLVARAQQQTKTPVIGFLSAYSLDLDLRELIPEVRRGLSETGYFEGRNLAFEHRAAEGYLERLPALADNLVRLKVAAIIAPSHAPALAAQAAANSIPIIFSVGTDPVDTGLVGSLNRPGGNLTGVTILGNASSGKRLELLHELVPTASIAYLVSVVDPGSEAPQFEATARTLGIRSHIVDVRDKSEFEATFVALVGERVGAVLVGASPLLLSNTAELVALAAHYRLPAMYPLGLSVRAGGLMSYSADLREAFRVVGVYTGRILKGEKPADLPVQQVTKMQLSINLKTVKALGLTIPSNLLALADEVIE